MSFGDEEPNERRELGSDRLASDTEPCPAGPELSSCSRCGLPFGHQPNHCGDFTGGDIFPGGSLADRVACRDRELGNVRALLRGSTRQLERIMQSLNDLLEVLS